MYFTYVLQCTNTKTNINKFYTGFSEKLPERFEDHISKSVKTTKSFDKIELVYYEVCFSKKDAKARETQLKKGSGRGY